MNRVTGHITDGTRSSTTAPASTIVLSGVGPTIKVKLPSHGSVTVVTGTKVKTISLNESANVQFAA